MAEILTVNRSLEDKAMDNIDHALGRPLDPMGKTHRNFYCEDSGSELARKFRESPFWYEDSIRHESSWFMVTDEGRAALRDHLKTIKEPHRAYVVEHSGHQTMVAAKSRSAARAAVFRMVHEVRSSLTFGQFIRTAKVRNG
jgi:hypothetical protein